MLAAAARSSRCVRPAVPGEPDNKKDTIFDPSLVVAMDTAGEKKLARYDFVLDLG